MSKENTPLPRSPLLMSSDDSALLIVDMQTKLLAAMPDAERLVSNAERLITAANLLAVPIAATEQYPKGLGKTEPRLASRLPAAPEKLTFSCGECGQIFADWSQKGIRKILLAGIESHVCVLQTAMDLLTAQFDVYLAVDAVGSRNGVDQRVAVGRMEAAGVTLVTTEMALFEWCQTAASKHFKTISGLAKDA